MDDWNDFGAPAPDPSVNGDAPSSSASSFASERTSHSAPNGSGSWSANSSGGAAEPRSVMFRGPPRRREPTLSHLTSTSADAMISLKKKPAEMDLGADVLDKHRGTSSFTADQDLESGFDDTREFGSNDALLTADLDTVGDFDEIGVSRSDRRTYSLSDRFHRNSYTKLEVVSAQQIQELLHCFHVLIAMAVSWTVFTIICSNFMFSEGRPVWIQASMLKEAQQSKLSPMPLGFRRDVADNVSLDPPYLLAVRSAVFEYHPQYNMAECDFRRQGVYYEFNELVAGPKLGCDNTTDPCYVYWKAQCEGEVATSVRQGSSGDALRNQTPLTRSGGRTFSKEMRVEALENWYKWLVHILILIAGLSLLALGTLFVVRLVRVGRANISQEQMFAAALLFVAFIYFNVPLSVMQINNLIGGQPAKFPQWLNRMDKPLRLLRDCTFGPFMIFYLWANIHSYRILDPLQKLGPRFYLPKIALLAPYAVIKLCAFVIAKTQLSELPFISAIIVWHSFGRFQYWQAYPRQVIFIITVSLYELLLLVITIAETAKTMRALRRAPYMRHRSKHTGFRFFIYVNFAYYTSFLFLQIALVIGRPVGNTVANLVLASGTLTAYVIWSHTVGTTLLTFGYVVLSAYVNLPFDSVGTLKGWVKGTDLAPTSSRWSSSSGDLSTVSDADARTPSLSGSSAISRTGTYSVLHSSRGGSERSNARSLHQPTFIVDKDHELNQEIVEPVTYRKRESNDALELRANCFTMQTHVILFNFAWYVYYYGTSKFERFERDRNDEVLPFRFNVFESIVEKDTDTHALVIDCSDRIIVAFKGSTSMRNLKTSIQIYHERLLNVVPTDLDNVSELQRLQKIFGRSYETAKIHKGFAMAYASVSHRVMRSIKRLIDEHPRPVFLTGHSLGGALATICSLDVWIKLRISRRQIFVSTFGSPRVGNESFRRIYNSAIALHWRIVVDPDMVPKVPKVGYRHVGKKVVLTPHGHMFIDPSSLELKLWSGSTSGFAYHRKASYLLAMKAWCVQHHKMTYTPVFWPFPVHEEDYQRFAAANMDEDDAVDEQMAAHGQLIAKKIIMLDAMVDKLDSSSFTNTAAVEKWARLTRRLLLRHKLSKSVNNSFA